MIGDGDIVVEGKCSARCSFLSRKFECYKQMRSKALPLIILAVLTVVVFVLRKFRTVGVSQQSSNSKVDKEANRNHGFDRRTSYLEYTKHARCRMECRQIDESEVQEIMRNGVINYRKSDVDAHPCPTYALEGMTHDNQHVRIVYAQCDYKTKVVTVIDLDHEWECHCDPR